MSVRQTACTCAMWTYHAQLLLVVCSLLTCTEVTGTACDSEQVLQVQNTCRHANQALLKAEADHDDVKVCESLFELWRCVAGNVPVCFHDFTDTYKNYFHSPHNCALSPEQIMMLQNLTMQTAKKEGEGDVDVEVDIVPLSSSPSTPLDVSSSSSSREDDEGGEGGDSVTVGENTKGDMNKHTGNGASISRQYGLPVVLLSWLAAFKMTSYLLHS